MKHYHLGARNEERVARSLRGRGASVCLHAGSRGPGATDLEAVFPSGTAWLVQVKSSRTCNKPPRCPSPADRGRLKARATRLNATPIVAYVQGSEIAYESARSGRSIDPPA